MHNKFLRGFAVCSFKVALILFVAAWTALADVLPDVSPEEQYRFSLGKALANDLVTAEAAFDEFREVNKGHERFAAVRLIDTLL